MPTEREKLLAKQITSQRAQDSLSSLMGLGRAQATLLALSSLQSISTGTYTAITWNTVVADGLGGFDGATRITAPQSGLYLVNWSQSWNSSNTAGISYLTLYKNGVRAYEGNPAQAATDTNRRTFNTVVLQASVGDYFETFAWQNSGGTRDIGPGTQSGIANHQPFFALTKL